MVAPPEPVAVLRAAARGQLPGWAEVSRSRRAHIERVGRLLQEWAETLDLPTRDRDQWIAAAWLHDALKDAPEERLRSLAPPEFRDAPAGLLHGPAAATLVEPAGDESVTRAIRYHTTGHPDLDRVGKALYAADYLEPGREDDSGRRADLRSRMPDDFDAVILEIARDRLLQLIENRRPIRPETAAFWSTLVREE